VPKKWKRRRGVQESAYLVELRTDKGKEDENQPTKEKMNQSARGKGGCQKDRK